MDKNDLSKLLQEECSRRKWSVLRLSHEARVPYETARRAHKGLREVSMRSTSKLLEAVGQELVTAKLEASPAIPAVKQKS